MAKETPSDNLEKQIEEQIGEIRIQSLDLSFGEIISLHENKELLIEPDYQRLFRWSNEQRSRLIESVILKLPIPQIFLIENDGGVLELIDGLQRISSVIQFINSKLIDLDPLELQGCDLINELNGMKFEDLPLTLKLNLKRSYVKTIIIQRQSKSNIRFEMFKRLNTGGTNLSAQEIRNVSSRMVGEFGVKFYGFLQDLSQDKFFKNCIETLSDSQRDQREDEELVLRFFAVKNYSDNYSGNVTDWLDNYMEGILLKKINFNFANEKEAFHDIFETISNALGTEAFVLYKNDKPTGGLKPAYFEAVTVGVFQALLENPNISNEKINESVIQAIQSTEFRKVTGPGANSKPKLLKRVGIVKKYILK